jgi:hypothetical protein
MGPKLKGRYIILSSQPDARLHIAEEQGDEPMLCRQCDNRLGTEIENPTRKWISNQTSGPSVEADGVLLARYAASVWWRAMLSKHDYYQHVLFDRATIRPLMEVSLNPSATYKNVSFRLRKLTDSGGAMSETALSQFIVTVAGSLIDEKLVRGHACFALIHDGFVCEVFSPRLGHSKIVKLKCFSSDRSRYVLKSLDFSRSTALLSHGVQVYSKYEQGSVTATFGRAFPSARG